MLNHNKSMLRVLLLVLSVLMVVSLAACGNDSSNDDMNAALSQAIADQQAALESQKKAQEDALAAQKAAQDAALAAAESERKAAEESLKAEAEQAKKDAEAAEQAAKKAEESAKAAAEAQKKAEESMKKAEESRKKAESESAKKAEESRKEYEASVAASISAALATSAPETTEAPVSNTEAIKSVIADFSKLQAEYNANLDMYVGNNASEILMLFQKASIDLTFATTLEAAQDIYNQLVIDVEAVESAATVAADVQALIAALGDVETEVITTSATKLNAAKDAWYKMVETYGAYLHEENVAYNADKAITEKNYYKNYVAACEETAEEDLGVAISELNKADKKIQVLVDYIKNSLKLDIKALYDAYELDFDDEGDDLTPANKKLIGDAYYKYQIISVVNGGDVSAADTDVEWDYLYNDDGSVKKDPDTKEKLIDTEKPILTVTAEQFIDVFAVPYLNAELKAIVENNAKTGVVDQLKAIIDDAALFNALVALTDVELGEYEYNDVDGVWDDIVEDFADELDATTFANTYKTKVTLDDAKADIYNKAVAVYVDLMDAFIETAKEFAKEYASDVTETTVNGLNDNIEDWKDELEAEDIRDYTVEKLNGYIAKAEASIVKAEADLEAFIANVDAARMYTVEELLSDEVAELYKKNDDFADISKLVKADIETCVKMVAADIININFASEIKQPGTEADDELGKTIEMFVEDLLALRDRLDPENYNEKGEFSADSIFNVYKGAKLIFGDGNAYEKTDAFKAIVATLDEAVAKLEALPTAGYEDKNETLIFPNNDLGDSYKDQKVYFISQAAMDYAKGQEKYYDEDEAVWLESGFVKANKDELKQIVTKSATDFPMTVVYTAEQQAMIEAQNIYNTVLDAIDAALHTYWKVSAKSYKEGITKDARYTALTGKYTGALKTQITDFAAIYTKKMDDEVAKVDYIGKYESFKTDFKLNATHFATPSEYVANKAVIDLPARQTTVKNKLTEYKTTFEGFFYNGDATTVTNVLTLWNLRNDYVKAVTEELKSFKNTYTLINDKDSNVNGWYIFEANKTAYQYDEADGEYVTYKTTFKAWSGSVDDVIPEGAKLVYNEDGVTIKGYYEVDKIYPAVKEIDADAQAYHAQIDQLIADYTAKINAVVLSSNVDVKDWQNNPIFATKNDKSKESDRYLYNTISDVKYYMPQNTSKNGGLERATVILNAYVVDLFGYNYNNAAVVGETFSNTDIAKLYTGTTWEPSDAGDYINVDSRVFNAYKAIFVETLESLKLTKTTNGR